MIRATEEVLFLFRRRRLATARLRRQFPLHLQHVEAARERHFPSMTSPAKVPAEGIVTVDDFISEWQKSGGNERANTQTFINDLCELLGVQRPRATQSDMAANDYVFERHVVKTEIDGTQSNGWID